LQSPLVRVLLLCFILFLGGCAAYSEAMNLNEEVFDYKSLIIEELGSEKTIEEVPQTGLPLFEMLLLENSAIEYRVESAENSNYSDLIDSFLQYYYHQGVYNIYPILRIRNEIFDVISYLALEKNSLPNFLPIGTTITSEVVANGSLGILPAIVIDMGHLNNLEIMQWLEEDLLFFNDEARRTDEDKFESHIEWMAIISNYFDAENKYQK